MLIHLRFPPLVIISMLHLLKQGMERRGKKLLRPRAVAAISDVEGGLVAPTALLEIGNAWPSTTMAWAREEREARASTSGKRERGKEVTVDLRIRERINGPHSKTIWAESQLRFNVRHYRRAALPYSKK